MSIPTPKDVDQLEHMLALVTYFRAAGCCSHCALPFSIATVEMDAGREWTPASEPCPECREKATAAWKHRPRSAGRGERR